MWPLRDFRKYEFRGKQTREQLHPTQVHFLGAIFAVKLGKKVAEIAKVRDGPNTTTTIIFQKSFASDATSNFSFDDTSDEKSLRFLYVPLCRRV